MTAHLFLGGPAHLETYDLPHGTPPHWAFPVFEKVPVMPWPYEKLMEPPEIKTFSYVPRRVRDPLPVLPPMEATVYVPEHMSDADQWELVKFCGLGQVAEG